MTKQFHILPENGIQKARGLPPTYTIS